MAVVNEINENPIRDIRIGSSDGEQIIDDMYKESDNVVKLKVGNKTGTINANIPNTKLWRFSIRTGNVSVRATQSSGDGSSVKISVTPNERICGTLTVKVGAYYRTPGSPTTRYGTTSYSYGSPQGSFYRSAGSDTNDITDSDQSGQGSSASHSGYVDIEGYSSAESIQNYWIEDYWGVAHYVTTPIYDPNNS